jgi:predicted RNase H-like HicB family nuclease
MNANELADELTKMFRGEEYDRLIHEIPNMLRQQQAEIEALKNGGDWLKKTFDALIEENNQLKEALNEKFKKS